MPRPLPIALFLAAGLLACESEDSPLNGGGGGGGGPDGENLTRFELRTTEDDGSERLRWVGNGNGPFAESPEQTEVPWVGYGRKFRVNFLMRSRDTAVQGYQVQFGDCETACNWWPHDGSGLALFEAEREWVFDPTLQLDEVSANCLRDPACAPDVYLPSGEFVFWVRAIDDAEAVIENELGRLAIQVNYAPSVELQEDGDGSCDDDALFPHYLLTPAGGGAPELCSFAAGDTIPVGAIVHMKLSGEDRLEGTSPDGSLCCDERADLAIAEVRFQGRLEFQTLHDRGYPESHSTLFSPLSDGGELIFRVGPFDYSFSGRARDEHGRPAAPDPVLDFVGGFAPRLTQIEPAQGARILLRNPASGSPWPENEFAYRVEPQLTRYWDSESRRFYDTQLSGTTAIEGTLFHLEPRWLGAADPREQQAASDENPPEFSGGVLSWAYEWFSDSDPENERGDGPGGDDLAYFNLTPAVNEWDLGLDGGFDLFVPSLIWTAPQLFDCDDPSLFCEIGDYLAERLGTITLLVRGRSTRADAEFRQCSPGVTESANCVDFSLERRGRYSAIEQRQFSWQLGLDADGDGQFEAWPPLASPKRERLSEQELRLRIAQPRR